MFKSIFKAKFLFFKSLSHKYNNKQIIKIKQSRSHNDNMDKNLKLVTKLISTKHALNWFKILKKNHAIDYTSSIVNKIFMLKNELRIC